MKKPASIALSCLSPKKVKFCLIFTVNLIIGSFLVPKAAYAIPSPELVIGSVSSLGQVMAVVFASISGFGAIIASRLGIKRSGEAKRYPVKLLTALTLIAVGLAFANHWQWSNYKAEEQARLQATLFRPAPKVQDETLKQTSFSAQTDHPQAITTDEAAALLDNDQARFFDIRETAENAMGTLPGAMHIRFPDFRQSIPVSAGEKVVLFCHNGNRSSETCAELAKLGIDCSFIAGGIEKWIVEGRDFSDKTVQSLSDLRAIPEYPGKTNLLNTEAFAALMNTGDLQIVDTRYPADFAAGHLPGAINIPIRAMTTDALKEQLSTLASKPTVAACYDRRSCFMSQVLGLEMTQVGIPFEGRYTVPWEFFEAPAPKPHVAEWLAQQENTLWQHSIDVLSDAMIWVHDRSHILLGLLGFAVLSRLLVLPIAMKSERDQIVSRDTKAELEQIKADLASDPIRKARAVKAYYNRHNLTPGRNMLALAFLPVMMLGVSTAEQAAGSIVYPFLWAKDLGAPDPLFIAPLLFTALAAAYLLWAVAKTRRQAILWCAIGLPVLLFMVAPLSLAANLYLCMALALLLVQRAFVSGAFQQLRLPTYSRHPKGVVPLGQSDELVEAGNKALRLSEMKNAGLPVPMGVVLRADFLNKYAAMSKPKQTEFASRIWQMTGEKTLAVRSSASHEDGAEQSFAGVFESVLDVTKDRLRTAIDTVNASFHSARAASYEGDASGHGNILVQQMVDADFAGVLFTQDPTAPGMSMIEWVEGCGEALVSGHVTPDTARFGRYSKLAAEERSYPVDFGPLLNLAQRIEDLFGAPQDIEWAYTDGKFLILQSRDITTLAATAAQDATGKDQWRTTMERFKDKASNEVILEQDEMSEVLPRPSLMSFSIMTTLWAPGGALDLACRELGLPYHLPEGRDAHLVRLFGKTYVDTGLKAKLALDLSGGAARRLRKTLRPTQARFEAEVLPRLEDQLAMWKATNYEALPRHKLIETIERLYTFFAQDIYVEAEKINLLAAFAMGEATKATAGDPSLRSHLMQADLPHTPASLLSSCRGTQDQAEAKALKLMGHRAMFDYELSTPRYSEAPGLLFSLLEPDAAPLAPEPMPKGLPQDLQETLQVAIAYQDLKEHAKHESLRLLAELRRALLALGAQTGLNDLVFSLPFETVLTAQDQALPALRKRAEAEAAQDRANRELAPKQTRLTLRDCELLSMGAKATGGDGALGGTCVAGKGHKTGRVFRVEDDTAYGNEAFEGFLPGDVIVCRMVNPAWLPQVQQAGAVLSEVGGWLSHMSIVAREKQILMLVGCVGLDALEDGADVTVDDTGGIQTPTAESDGRQTSLRAISA